MGGDEFSQKYLDKLELDIDEAYTQYKAANESKNIFKAARTPGVYFVIAIVMYVLSGVFGLVGLYVFANFCNLVMGILNFPYFAARSPGWPVPLPFGPFFCSNFVL
jgi:atlastin